MNSEEINALPEKIRKYIHDLETICDPAGMVQEIACKTDQIAQLQAKLEKYEGAYRHMNACRALAGTPEDDVLYSSIEELQAKLAEMEKERGLERAKRRNETDAFAAWQRNKIAELLSQSALITKLRDKLTLLATEDIVPVPSPMGISMETRSIARFGVAAQRVAIEALSLTSDDSIGERTVEFLEMAISESEFTIKKLGKTVSTGGLIQLREKAQELLRDLGQEDKPSERSDR